MLIPGTPGLSGVPSRMTEEGSVIITWPLMVETKGAELVREIGSVLLSIFRTILPKILVHS